MDLGHRKENLLKLVNEAYSGEVLLPDFQRNFVWTRNDIEELIKSLLEDMFIGTFLILDTNPSQLPFKAIFVQGAELVNPEIRANPRKLILDGQQRLTSVFYAVYSPDIPLKNTENPYAFFIDLEKLAKNEVEEAVFSWSKKWREYRSILDDDGNYNYAKLMEKRLLPLTILKDSDAFYDLWYSKYKKLFAEDIAKKIKSYIGNILKYEVYTLTLGVQYNDKPEEIAMLFERINKTGVKLSTYDLLVARLYKFIKLREEWEKAYEENHYIKTLSSRIDDTNVPYSFIQALALAKGKSIKARDMLKIDEGVLNKEQWEKVVNLVENKVLPRFLNPAKYGVPDVNRWLPYYPTITLMVAFYLKHRHPDMDKLDTWYWSSVFSERYSGSTETLMMRDFREVSQWFEDDSKIPEVVQQLRVQLSSGVFSLKNVNRRSSAKYKGVFNLLFMNGAKDFHHPDDLSFNELEDHHIFPKKFLEENKIDVDYDTALNRTLIFDKTNRKIWKKSPSEYIQDMIRIYGSEAKVRDILKLHFIDEEMYKILKATHSNLEPEKIKRNFENFISRREKLIIEKIKELVKWQPPEGAENENQKSNT